MVFLGLLSEKGLTRTQRAKLGCCLLPNGGGGDVRQFGQHGTGLNVGLDVFMTCMLLALDHGRLRHPLSVLQQQLCRRAPTAACTIHRVVCFVSSVCGLFA